MNITKIKRGLARIGIGNPLNQLFYTSAEITNMKKLETLITPTKVKSKQWSFKDKNKGKIGIRSGTILVYKSFYTTKEALKWAKWNYKNKLDNITFETL